MAFPRDQKIEKKNRLKLCAHRHIELIVLICIIAVCAFATYRRNAIWENDLCLWGDVLKKSPQKARPYNNLGLAYKEQGLLDEAIRLLSKSAALDPDRAKPHYNLGLCYLEKGWTDKAIVEFKRTIRIEPYNVEAYNHLGICNFNINRVDQAISKFQHAIRIDPDHAEAHYNLGVAYGSNGQYDLAFKEIRTAKKLLGSGAKWGEIVKGIKGGGVMPAVSGHP